MNELRRLLSDTTARVLADAVDKPAHIVWQAIADAGLHKVLVSEEAGGFGGTWEDALAVIQPCGTHATNAPLPEAILATHLAQAAELTLPDSMITIAAHAEGTLNQNSFSGTLRFVPWGRDASHVLTALGETLILLATADAKIEQHQNPASEPRDTLTFTNAPAQSAPLATDLLADLALLRTAQIAGALEHALALSVHYTRERKQFGRALAQFQAIQQQLAILAEETAAANMAAAAAFAAKDEGDAAFEIAAAKLRANRAARASTGIAHQVHGAMGFTAEYQLHPLTTRLWAYQTEAGNERHWAEKLGKQIARRGPQNFWPDLVARAER